MKTLRLWVSFAFLIFTLSSSLQPVIAQTSKPVSGPSGGSGFTINLPILMNGQPSSFDLIDRDIASGNITAEQGLIYKVYALFSDAALPAGYISSSPILEDGDQVMRDVVEQSATLSATAKKTLAPFFVPPDDSLSWYYRKHITSSAGAGTMQAKDVVWRSYSAAGGQCQGCFP